MARKGNSLSAAFNSCRQTTSGFAARSQRSRLGSRRLTLLMLKVAIFIEKIGSGHQALALRTTRFSFDAQPGHRLNDVGRDRFGGADVGIAAGCIASLQF